MMNKCIKVPQILIPNQCDMSKWAVIACDQFTSDREYWKKLENYVGESYSTLNLIFPEVYLKDEPEKRIKSIKEKMTEYKANGVFKKLPEGFILVERQTPYADSRYGLILSIDLENYSFEKKSSALIRATEATILERIPPRVKIRQGAQIEFPHIMLLIDDKENSVMGELISNKQSLEKLYDFDLNMGGGHLKGYFISDTEKVINSLNQLIDDEVLTQKYGRVERLLFAVGDGNHSLATAKCCWEELKKTLSVEEQENHPARFALCEVVNLYDEGLKFEPIHRVVFGVDAKKFISGLTLNGQVRAQIVLDGKETEITLGETLPGGIASLDEYISQYIKENGGEVDYIHGKNELITLTKENDNCVGILLPAMDKNDMFSLIINGGSLPRKTFSMGEGVEKRYYVEGKEIVNNG